MRAGNNKYFIPYKINEIGSTRDEKNIRTQSVKLYTSFTAVVHKQTEVNTVITRQQRRTEKMNFPLTFVVMHSVSLIFIVLYSVEVAKLPPPIASRSPAHFYKSRPSSSEDNPARVDGNRLRIRKLGIPEGHNMEVKAGEECTPEVNNMKLPKVVDPSTTSVAEERYQRRKPLTFQPLVILYLLYATYCVLSDRRLFNVGLFNLIKI